MRTNELLARAHLMAFSRLAQLPGTSKAAALQRHFDRKFKDPDPWSYESDGERRRLDAVSALVPEDATDVLEIGCAEGHLTRRIRQQAPAATVHCIDISPRAIERARAHVGDDENVHITLGDVRQWPFASLPARIDVAVICDVLYYLGAPDKWGSMPQQLAEHLGGDGRVVVGHAAPLGSRFHAQLAERMGFAVRSSEVFQASEEYVLAVLTRSVSPTGP